MRKETKFTIKETLHGSKQKELVNFENKQLQSETMPEPNEVLTLHS